MSYNKWKIPLERTAVPAALTAAGCTPLLAAVLAGRGMSDPMKVGSFINCDRRLLGDPLMLADMPEAVRRLSQAIKKGEKVAVYGDYDVDGITSSCLLTDYLRSKGLDCELYIPDRIEEGYGLNTGAIEALHSRGVKLIVTVDCGVTAVEEAAFAASLGLDMIITDHHECREVLPAAAAVVDPKRPDCSYPGQELAGVGVAFKLLCAMEGSAAPLLERYADLVAVGTVADVMPLVGENRYIVKSGLEKLCRSPRPGLLALMEEAGLSDRKISATNVGFTLAPRINASGRLGKVDTAARLLLTEDTAEARALAEDLCRLNRDRQALEMDIWNEALAMIGSEVPDTPIVLACENWHQGVIGIVASRLTEAYNVPSIMICVDGGKGKGSCRSCGGFNLFEALSACSEHLESFGGHALAAGLTINPANIDSFRSALGEYYAAHPAQESSVLDIDIRIDDPALLDMRCVEDLDRLEPCGNGNPSPQLCICGAYLESVNPIGNGRHLRLKLSKFGMSYEAVFFSKTAEALGLRAGDYVDAAFQLQINDFRGRRSVQLLMTDMRRHELDDAKAVLLGRKPGCLDAISAPSREEFARLWRSFVHQGGLFRGSLEDMLETLAPDMWDVRLCLCLKVFQELGLISLDFDGSQVTIRRNKNCDKVDLPSSRILRQLER